MTPMSTVGAAFKMESCILPTVSFVLSLLRRSGGCMSRACCGVALSCRCGAYMLAACMVGGLLLHVHACFVCFCFCLFQSRSVLFCSVRHLFVLPALSLFFLSLSLSLSLPLSLSLLASAVGMVLIYLRETHGLRP